MVTLSCRRLAVASPWLVLLPTYGALDLILPVALCWAREPGWEAQGLAIQMAYLMASYGAMVGQWSLLAVWSALRPSRWLVTAMLSWAVASWYLRPGMSFAAFAWNFAAPVLRSWNEPNGGQSFIQLFIAVAGLICGWAAVAMPSFLAFCLTGYRLNSARRNALRQKPTLKITERREYS